MDLHANAVLTVRQRERVCHLVRTGVTITAAALVVGCSRQQRRSGSTGADAASRSATARAVHCARPGARPKRSSTRSCVLAKIFAKVRTSSAGRSRLPPRPCTRYCAGMDARGSSRECLEARSSATSAHDPASSCTSTASSDGSSRPATASPAIAHDEPEEPAGNTCSSRSTITRALASPRFTPTKPPTRRSRFWTSSSASTAPTASGSNVSSLTMAPASSGAGRTRAQPTRSPSRRPVPTDRRQTARPNASSAPSSSAGHTPTPTTPSQSAKQPCPRRSTSTIASDPTAR